MRRLHYLSMFFFVVGMASGAAIVLLATDVPNARAQQEALPIADLHFHPRPNLSPGEILRTMEHAGVRWAGNGAAGAPDDHWLAFTQAAPERFIPFVGQELIRGLIRDQGEKAWTFSSPEITSYLKQLEESLHTRRFRGIGELFVNNVRRGLQDTLASRYPADSPLMRRLFTIAINYQVPLSIHMNAETASVEELERLLTLDRKGTIIWAHCGGRRGDAGLIRRMLSKHPNLFCELSQRDDRPRPNPEDRRRRMITDDGRQLKPDWKALLEDYSDRFLVGTDSAKPEDYQGIIDFFRAMLAQLTPEAAKRIAHGNAKRLFRLAQ